MPKVTVYIPSHNYGKYVERAIESVLKQTMDDWELLVIDDGSTDNTADVISKYGDRTKVNVVTQENKGLNVTNNVALRLARGDYVMRLDADDFLDENCLALLSNVLDTKPDVGLVYPDYYHVDERGDVVELVRRKKIGEEVELLDLPAHGACTMIRREVLLRLGSYSEEFQCQDGYDIWLRMIRTCNPYNVNLPLFYYRKHSTSLTRDEERLHDTRREIKRRFVAGNDHIELPKTMGIVPVLSSSVYAQNRPFVDLAGKPLIWYTLSEAVRAASLDRLVVAADDDETLEFTREHFPSVVTFKRTGRLSDPSATSTEIVQEVLKYLQKEQGYEPEAVCMLYISTPLRKAKHIDQAVDTMAIFEVDSVVSIQEELAPCYHHERLGLTPINITGGQTRLERRAIYKENGAIFLNRRGVIESGQQFGQRVGHITMLPNESVKINSDFEFWLAQRIIEDAPLN